MLSETREDFVRAKAGHWNRNEFRLVFYCLKHFAGDPVADAIPTLSAHLNYSGFVHFVERLMETQEFNIGTAKVLGKVLVVQLVTGCGLFKYCGKQNSTVAVYMILFTYMFNVFPDFIERFLGQTHFVDFLENAVQASGLCLDACVFRFEVLSVK